MFDVRRLSYEDVLELATADDPEAKLGCEARSLEHHFDAVQRNQLADEQHGERTFRVPSGTKDGVLRADEAHVDRRVRQGREEIRVSLGVGYDEIRSGEGAPVDKLEHARCRGAGPEPPPIADERVREGDEWVEDDRAPARRSSCGRQVEVTGIPDDQGVALRRDCPREQPGLRARKPRQCRQARVPAVELVFPDGDVHLVDGDSGTAETRDHLRIPRIPPFVGSEIRDSQSPMSPVGRRCRCQCGGLDGRKSKALASSKRRRKRRLRAALRRRAAPHDRARVRAPRGGS